MLRARATAASFWLALIGLIAVATVDHLDPGYLHNHMPWCLIGLSAVLLVAYLANQRRAYRQGRRDYRCLLQGKLRDEGLYSGTD